jgi:hypothetical protein
MFFLHVMMMTVIFGQFDDRSHKTHYTKEELEVICNEDPWDALCEDFSPTTSTPKTEVVTNDTTSETQDR